MADLTRRADGELDIEKVLEALPLDHSALQLGEALCRCRSLSWRGRWRIGKGLLPYQKPQLAGTAGLSPHERWGREFRKAVEASQRIIEGRKRIGGAWEG